MGEQASGISPTQESLRDFLRGAVAKLAAAPAGTPASWDVDTKWERGPDGNFRQRTKRRPLSMLLTDEWLQSILCYDKCVEGLRSRARDSKTSRPVSRNQGRGLSRRRKHNPVDACI